MNKLREEARTNFRSELSNAEHAMDLAKDGGRDSFQYFTPSLQKQARTRLMLTDDLRGARSPATACVLVSDAEQAPHCLGTLHAAGAKASIDDFGTGFSALSSLKHYDVDYLKIDKSFINNLTEDGSDKALTEAIIGLAHRLGIDAVKCTPYVSAFSKIPTAWANRWWKGRRLPNIVSPSATCCYQP